MKLKGKYYIVKTYSRSYDTYHEEWWEVHESVLPITEAISHYFIMAEKKLEHMREEHRKQHKAILLKHGYKRLTKKHCPFSADSPFAKEERISDECRDELRELEKLPINIHWENYVEQVSKGKVRRLKPNIQFEWEEQWER